MSNEAHDTLYETGILRSDPTKILEEQFRPAYEWIAKRMSDRIGAPSNGGVEWPLWAWLKRDGEEQIDPNSDEFEGDDSMIVTFEIDLDKIVLSDYDSWHYILNQQYLPDVTKGMKAREKEMDAFDRDLVAAGYEFHPRPYPEPFWERMLSSWDRVFQITSRTKWVQATFWELSVDQVLHETPCYDNSRYRMERRRA